MEAEVAAPDDVKDKKWAKGIILVNEYKPPVEKTLKDFHNEVDERTKDLELPDFPPAINENVINEKLQGMWFILANFLCLDRGLPDNLTGLVQALYIFV